MKDPASLPLHRKKPALTTSITTFASRKLNVVCSFNGAFQLRPPSNKLRYIGGETRIISVDRNISFLKLRSKILDLCPNVRSFSLKYQLPMSGRVHGVDADKPLVSIASDEDVQCMIDEYDKLELFGKHARLWIFVCSVDSSNNECDRNGFAKRNGEYVVKNLVTGRCGNANDSLRKMGLKQQLLPKKAETILGVPCVNDIESELKYPYSYDYQKYQHPLVDLAPSKPNISIPNMQGSENRASFDNYPIVSRGLPLNPRDGNLQVNTKGSMKCLSGQSAQDFCNVVGVTVGNPTHSVAAPHILKQSQGIRSFENGFVSNLNRENIVPWGGSCDSIATRLDPLSSSNQWIGSVYPMKSPLTEHVLESWMTTVNCCLNEDPFSLGFQCSNDKSREYGSRSVSHCGNSKPRECLSAYHGVGNQSLLPHIATEKPSSCTRAMLGEEDLLTGSNNDTLEVPCQTLLQNFHSEHMNCKPNGCDIEDSFVEYSQKPDSISTLSNNLGHSSGEIVQCNTKLLETGAGIVNAKLSEPGAGIDSLSNHKNNPANLDGGITSSLNVWPKLSLSSKEVEPPLLSSLASNDVLDALLKPQLKFLYPMDEGRLSDTPRVEETNGVVSNIFIRSAAKLEKDNVHAEEIQQHPPSDLSIDEKADSKENNERSNLIGGIPSDLPALLTHLTTQVLQTIKNSDLEYIKELGSGAYGTVYYGKWKGSDVAIKKIKPGCFTEGLLEEDRLVADFWREAHILGQLHHPNIVAFYGVVTDGPMHCLATVTEYMVNGSLKQVLRKKDRTIDRRKRIILAMDAAFGMQYLHEKNIVHFDLKSHNCLVNMRDPQRPVCKIGDLGLSKIKQRTLVTGGVRGTIPWMAPELLNNKDSMVTEKVDVYSFGIVMWELLTGEEPYANKRSEEVIAGIIKGTLRPEIPSWCDPAWRSLMEKCWSSAPDLRPSFSEVAKELRAMSTGMNIR